MEAHSDPKVPGVATPDPKLDAELAAALASQGPGYVPRTHHKSASGAPTFTNRLIRERSPYLLQHAHNPVNWYPWGDEAFARAQALGRPVLLSIGYSTCHWCHVMERESFEDVEIAEFINQHYVAIKVDREERPDLDDVYMTAVQMMTGRGGWPMTVVLTPERKPFFGGTYFPARDGDRGSRKGFLTILGELRDHYSSKPNEVVARAERISRQMAEGAAPQGPAQIDGIQPIVAAVERLKTTLDPQHGGFGRAPKFPRPANLELLLRYARRSDDADARHAALLTLDKMVAGGMHDHVGGGFHRYSTDAKWLVPHFEKMLYDNAQLACALVDAWQLTSEARYADTTRSTLDYLLREMRHRSGGFYSATDADSDNPETGHQDEGWFFTWTPAELADLLTPEEAKAVTQHYAVSEAGNFEGRNIFHAPRPLEHSAAATGYSVGVLRGHLQSARGKLYAARQKRPPPLRDDKMLASWNGLALSAFARAAFAFDEERYAHTATSLADFILRDLRDAEGRLLRSTKDGVAGGRGYLDDYAFVIAGLLDLYSATSEPRWLAAAAQLQGQLDQHHHDSAGGGYFTVADDAEALIYREKPAYDGAEPSGNSVAAMNLLRLAELSGDEELRKRGQATLTFAAPRMAGSPAAIPKMLSALDYARDTPLQVIVVHPDDTRAPDDLLAPVRSSYLPNAFITVLPEGQVAARAAQVPAVKGKLAQKGVATAYVCERTVCQDPTSDPKQLLRQLKRVSPYPQDGSPPSP